MKKRPYAPAYPMEAGIESRTMVFYFGISLAIHLIFIGSMIFMPDITPRPRLGQGSIQVSLVSLPGPAQAADAENPPAAAPVAKTESVPQPEINPAPKAAILDTPPPEPKPVLPKPAPKTVSLAPKQDTPKVKKSLKKKTQNRRKMIDQALTGVQKNLEKSQSDSVRQALDRLKQKVAQSEAAASQSGQQAAGMTGAAGSGSPGAAGSGGRRALEIADLYKIEVAFQVERHWAFSPQLARNDKMLQTKVVFKVLPNGELTDIKFTEPSGNSNLDESVYRAIVKASPVSPHPAGIDAPYVTVAVRFTPEGLK